MPILLSQLAGCIVGVISVVLIAKFMGASQEVILSLAPKSVTTPIAMEVTKAIGGIPSLTAAVVVAVGLLGAICGFKTMKIMHVAVRSLKGFRWGQPLMLSELPPQWISAVNMEHTPVWD